MGIDALTGKDCGLYYDSADSYATPTWVEATEAIDVSLNMDKNIAEIMSRATSWTLSAAGTKSLAVEVGYLHTPGNDDTVFGVFQDMFFNDTVKQMAIMDDAAGLTSNDVGVRGFFICSAMNQEQELNGAVQWSFSFVPVRYDDSGTLRVPEWYEVA